jgi:hypothetical protein
MNGGLFMLSSAAANAFMCVISRVMRNCKASLVPASVVKSMSRFGVLAIELHWLQMQAGKRADDLQMAQFFRADIHQQIFPVRILAVEALHGVLHRRGELSVCAAELLEQHVPEPRVRSIDAHCVHQLFSRWYMNPEDQEACPYSMP